MQQVIAQLLDYAKGAWRFRWVAVAAAWVFALGGWIFVYFIPDRYESSTQVYVDTESLLKPLLEGLAVDRDVTSQVAMMQAVMLSRPNLAKVAEKTDLLLAAGTPEARENVLLSLENRITLEQSASRARRQQSSVFVVKFQDPDAKVAHRVVQTLLDTFMEDSLGLKRTDAGVAQRFLESQVREYEQRLYENEQRLAAFKKQNIGMMPGAEGDYYERLEAETGKLKQLQVRATQLIARRAEVAEQLESEPQTVDGADGSEFSAIDAQIARYRTTLDELLLKYTEKHPQVASLKQTIARLEKEKEEGVEVSSSVPPPGAELSASDQILQRSLQQNPMYQSLRMTLSQLDADLAQVRGEIGAQQGLILDLQTRMDTIPDVEAELARLNRDSKINKAQYDTLLERLESAKLSQQAEQSSENVKFRVIDPPTVSYTPVAPNRGVLNALVLLGALAAGIALAVMIAQLHPTIASRDALVRITGLNVLGSITVAVQAAFLPWYRRQGVLVGGAVTTLVVVYLLNVVLDEPLRHALRAVGG